MVCDGNMNRKMAEVKLCVSYRTISRYIAGYRAYGKAFFQHGNFGKSSSKALSSDTKSLILDLYRDPSSPIFNANFAIVTEFLNMYKDINVSESTVRNIFKDFNILPPRAWKSSRKKLKKLLMVNDFAVDDAAIFSSVDDFMDMDPHPSTPRKRYAGELIQMDASSFVWFYGDSVSHCHVAIDNATGCIVGIFLDSQETLFGYFNVLKQILSDHGIPHEIRSDRRTVFDYQRLSDKGASPNSFIQFKYVCNDLGILLSPTSSPQHKGQVECLNGTLQDRLTYFLKANDVSSIEQANALMDRFKSYFNERFAVPIKDSISCFDNQVSDEKINLCLSVKSKRIISNGNTISLNNKKYIPIDEDGNFIFLSPKTRVMTIRTLDNSLYVSVENGRDLRVFSLKEVPKHLDCSTEFDFKQPSFYAKDKTIIPNPSHSWRVSVFEAFLVDSEEYFDNSVSFEEMMYSTKNHYISNLEMPYEFQYS